MPLVADPVKRIVDNVSAKEDLGESGVRMIVADLPAWIAFGGSDVDVVRLVWA